MEKTKLGVSVGFLGAIVYLFGLISGYVITGLLVGYILLKEENIWLKKQSVRAVILMLLFSLVSVVLGVIPDFLGIFNNIIPTLGGYLSFGIVEGFFNIIRYLLDIAKTVVFVLLSINALNQGTAKLPVIDDLVNKYMD